MGKTKKKSTENEQRSSANLNQTIAAAVPDPKAASNRYPDSAKLEPAAAIDNGIQDLVSSENGSDDSESFDTHPIQTSNNTTHVFNNMPHSEIQSGTDDDDDDDDDTQSNSSENHSSSHLASNGGFQLEYDVNSVGNCIIELKDLSQGWGPTLVGYMAGRYPGKNAIREFIQTWSVQCKLSIHPSRWLIFRFNNDFDMNTVLENGPYFISRCPLLLKVIPPFSRFNYDEVTKFPLWVCLPSLPPKLWNGRSLSKILSTVGKPIRTDALTASNERLSYARALMEVNFSKHLTVPVQLPNGSIYQQQIEFEFVPYFCYNCNEIGHNNSYCLLRALAANIDSAAAKTSEPAPNTAAVTHATAAKRQPAPAAATNAAAVDKPVETCG